MSESNYQTISQLLLGCLVLLLFESGVVWFQKISIPHRGRNWKFQRGVCGCVCVCGGGGGWGSMAQEIPEGRRGECMDRLVFRGSTSRSCRAQLFKIIIATY